MRSGAGILPAVATVTVADLELSMRKMKSRGVIYFSALRLYMHIENVFKHVQWGLIPNLEHSRSYTHVSYATTALPPYPNSARCVLCVRIPYQGWIHVRRTR